ncbi:MAG TPA: hypothetical protein VM532_06760 [Burkholderiales bacterium]|nr:hypothetical protein [Burkholderiales bacterium]
MGRYPLLIFLLAASASVSGAPERSVTPEQSLDDDLAGPRVVWLGQITQTLVSGDDTCFVLNRVQALYGGYAYTATKFVACNPGGFAGDEFPQGKILRVEGNLGEDMPRRIGGQDIHAHLVAAPRLDPQPDFVGYQDSPFYDRYPYRSPFYDPWGPHFHGWGGYYHRRH